MAPSWVLKSDAAAVARDDQMSTAETIGLLESTERHIVGENGAQVIWNKPPCLGASRPDGGCISFQLPKVRMVRVAKPHAASVGLNGNSAKSGVATAQAATKVEKSVAEPKKTHRAAHRQSPRRNQTFTRGYASRERGNYGRQGFAQNFW